MISASLPFPKMVMLVVKSYKVRLKGVRKIQDGGLQDDQVVYNTFETYSYTKNKSPTWYALIRATGTNIQIYRKFI
jgi:hypothetical protein